MTDSVAQTDADSNVTVDATLPRVENVTEVDNVTEVELQTIVDPVPNRFDRQLLADLDLHQQRVFDALEEEDAFSLKLSELYSEYGALLIKGGRLDEAREVFSQALHIQKVNHGIYSIEQLYYLNKLFEIELQLDTNQDDELIEQYLGRAISIEKKNKDVSSHDLDEMLINAGHYFLDVYYRQTRRLDIQLDSLRSARHYFNQVLLRNTKLDKEFIPYGELFLVTYLESNIISDLPLIIDNARSPFSTSSERLFRGSEQRSRTQASQAFQLERDFKYLRNSYNRGFNVFNSYIRKAQNDGNTEDVVRALLGWADTLTLFNRSEEASEYYKLAWTEAQSIDSNQNWLDEFNQPKLIPAYEYLVDRQTQQAPEGELSMPLILSVTKDGSVSEVQGVGISEEQAKQFKSVRKDALKLNFRPAIMNGETIDTNEFAYEARVPAK